MLEIYMLVLKSRNAIFLQTRIFLQYIDNNKEKISRYEATNLNIKFEVFCQDEYWQNTSNIRKQQILSLNRFIDWYTYYK